MKNYTPVTDAMLENPDPGDWLMIRRNYQAWSHSPLTQVNATNVKELQLVWTWAMNEGGANEPTPIVHNGVMFLANTGNIVQALNASTGELIWENRIGPDISGGLGAIRSLALYQDKVYLATTDVRLVALDARTGKQVWETRIADTAKGYSNTSGPIVVNGKVIQGMGGCDRYKETGCYISAYDAQTGKQVWKFETVARVDAPHGETWGNLPNLLRAGGDTWITGSYDPELNLTYWGVAQAKPWMRAIRGTNAAALYTSSTLALNPDTGKLDWYFQHVPGESLDLDTVYERVLLDYGGQNLLFTIGKDGLLWKLDRKSGKFLDYKSTVFQNVFDSIDPKTGEVHYRNEIVEQRPEEWVQSCPSTEGGHNWQAMSYSPPTGQLIIPLSQSCMEMYGRKTEAERRFRRHLRQPPLLRNARHQRQHRQASRLRHQNHEGKLEASPARAFPNRRPLDRRRPSLRRRPRPRLQSRRRKNRHDPLANPPRHFRTRFPRLLQRRRQTIHSRLHRPRRRQPAPSPRYHRRRRPPPRHRQRPLRIRAAR